MTSDSDPTIDLPFPFPCLSLPWLIYKEMLSILFLLHRGICIHLVAFLPMIQVERLAGMPALCLPGSRSKERVKKGYCSFVAKLVKWPGSCLKKRKSHFCQKQVTSLKLNHIRHLGVSYLFLTHSTKQINSGVSWYIFQLKKATNKALLHKIHHLISPH